MSGLRLSPRERLSIGAGLAIVIAALVLTRAVLPFARHWQARELIIATELERLARLRGLIAAEPGLELAVTARTAELESRPARLLAGRTSALAASTLQSFLQDVAVQSRVVITRLDVAGEPDPEGAAPTIPATVSATGDIHGITEVLSRLQHGQRLIEVTGLTIRPNPALRGELLQMTVRLRAGWTGVEPS